MIASADDARLLFSKWQETSPSIRIKLMSSSLIFDAIGTVTDFAPGSLQLGGDSWQFTIPLGDVTFSFSDPREIPVPSVRNLETEKYEFALSIRLPNGEELVLMELKASADDEERANSEED
jgi:hypothetical protein